MYNINLPMAKNSLAVVGCIEAWSQKPTGDFRISIFGGVKNREVLMGQLRAILSPLKLKDVHLVSHEGCLAYAARKFGSKDLEREALMNDLRNTRAAVMAEMPKLKVKTFIQAKNGKVSEVE